MNRDDLANRVIDGMLDGVRAPVSRQADDGAVRHAKRILQLRPGCAEAAFWLGLAQLRQHRNEEATQALRNAYDSGRGKSVEPALYLGMHLLRQGQSKEALRLLGEANKAAGH